MTANTAPDRRTGGEWLQAWNPNDEATWDKSLAWRTLWITTFSLTMAFIAWFLPSAIIPKLNAIGYSFTKDQLYWMAAMPGLAAGLNALVGKGFRVVDRMAERRDEGRAAAAVGAQETGEETS